MLVLTRAKEEAIIIGDSIEVRVLDVRGDRVRLGIVAPGEVSIHRKEVYLAIQKENLEAARSTGERFDDALDMLRRDPDGGKDTPRGKRDGGKTS